MDTEKKDTKIFKKISKEIEPVIVPLVDEEKSETVEEIATPVKKNPTDIGIVNSNETYLRLLPDDHSEIKMFMKKGDAVIVDNSKEYADHYYVTANNMIGYISKNKININIK